MVLTKFQLENSDKVSLEFDDRRNDFRYFESIFRSMREIDSFHSDFLTDLKGERTKVRSEVNRISMQSPTWLEAFISEHWYETLLFIWGAYDRIRPNAQMIIEDVAQIFNTVDQKLREISADVRDYSFERIQQLTDWFNRLTFREKERILRMMKRISETLDNLRRLIF